MVNGLSQNYLNTLVPPTVGSSSYNLHRPNKSRNIACRTRLCSTSFLPGVIDEWNSLPDENKIAESLYRLTVDKPCPLRLYFFGERKIQIIHARLRTR